MRGFQIAGVRPGRAGEIEPSELLLMDDLEGYERLRRENPVPIGGGGHKSTAAAFELWMRRGLLAVVQLDVCWCGGPAELAKIYQMARRSAV
ncbi:MAG: hypothetical protein HYZ81_26620 [Nitrospinae bacterium]|nr:hypothetical protein [Nitrospinota bacterium]